jgi:cbb3-type cytochrome oxidase cytochrome c subunit
MRNSEHTRWLLFALALALALLGGSFALPLAQPRPKAFSDHFSVTKSFSPQQEEGRKLFEQSCTACHTIGGGVRVGPDLKGVTERRDLAWLKRFILEPDQMLKEEDATALAMLKEFGIPMPNLALTVHQVEALIAYLQTTTEAEQIAPVAIPALYIPTLAIGVLVIAALTVIGLIAARKRVEVRT